ncbi:MAG: lysoplasmalogenase family protein, partial [Pseudomonadota bacterium]
MAVLLAGLCILSVTILLYAEERGLEAIRAASKISASLCFVGVALFSGAMEIALGLWILAGLVLSLAGDALLLSSRRITFLCGMAAFGLAHIAYTAGFWVSGTASLNDWGRSLFLTLVFTGLV